MARKGRSELEVALSHACVWSWRNLEQTFQRLYDRAAMAHPRVRAAAAFVAARVETDNDTLRAHMADAVARARESTGPDIPAELEPLMLRIERQIGLTGAAVRDEELKMLDSILDDPSDDEARAVYADWLSQRGDPQGEFIALQLRSDVARTKSRQADLLARYRDVWTLDLVGLVDHALFRRGFVAEARYCSNLWPWTFERRGYGTVEALEMKYDGNLRHFRPELFRALRKLAPLSWREMLDWSGPPAALPLQHIGVVDYRELDAETAERVRELTVGGWLRSVLRVDILRETFPGPVLEVLFDARRGPQLTELGVVSTPDTLGEWMRFRAALGLTAVHVGVGASWRHVVDDALEVSLRADTIRVTFAAKPGRKAEDLAPWLTALEGLAYRPPVEVVIEGKLKLPSPLQRRIDDVAGPIPSKHGGR